MSVDAYTALTTRKEAILAELAALTADAAGGRPNISGGGGMVDHVGYKRSLYDELTQINIQLDAMQGPWELPLEGRSA